MKKWWMKGLAVALCAGMLASAAAVSVPGMGMTVYAINNGAGASGADDPKKMKIQQLLQKIRQRNCRKRKMVPWENFRTISV